MTNRERFLNTLNFQPVDRLPIVEWAHWWDKTVTRWYEDGLSRDLIDPGEIREYFGLDCHRQYWVTAFSPECPAPASHGASRINNREEYLAIKKYLYPDTAFNVDIVKDWAKRQEAGDMVVWISLEGFFWFPRTLFGIEPHMFAFYDYPDLMKEINEDLVTYQLRVLDEFCNICVPDFMTFAEDMSYNHGPMLSKNQFDEFMAPYYRRVVPKIAEYGTIPFVDTDGDVTKPVAWFEEVGIKGLLPLERMAGVDISAIRENHPQLRMIGAYDKTIMHLGEERMREEFERILPVMKQGGYIPAVDHQTPPDVSLEQYRVYVRLLREYCGKAAKG